MKYEVSIARCGSYDGALVHDAIGKCLAPLGGMDAFVHPGDRVLIKLNLLSAQPPECAVTTHPSVVRAAVDLVQECGGHPVIGDSPGGKNTGRSYRRLLRKTGIQQVIDETGCESVFFDADVIEIFSETPRTFRKFPVPRILTEVDRVICLPKLKTHTLTGMTGAVKLLYGYLPGVTKAEYHFSCGNDHARFAELLADLSVAFPPELSIMDAVMGMEGDGPQGGEPRKIGLVMAGTSCPALDMAAAAVMGFEPGEVLPLENLIARGACPRSPDEIAIHGERIRDVTVPDLKKPQSGTFLNLPPLLLRIAQGFLSAAPSIETSACIRCGTCAEDCPAGAIAWSKGEHPRIRYRSCIRCFCCQELCPEGAVSVRIPLLRRLIG